MPLRAVPAIPPELLSEGTEAGWNPEGLPVGVVGVVGGVVEDEVKIPDPALAPAPALGETTGGCGLACTTGLVFSSVGGSDVASEESEG